MMLNAWSMEQENRQHQCADLGAWKITTCSMPRCKSSFPAKLFRQRRRVVKNPSAVKHWPQRLQHLQNETAQGKLFLLKKTIVSTCSNLGLKKNTDSNLLTSPQITFDFGALAFGPHVWSTGLSLGAKEQSKGIKPHSAGVLSLHRGRLVTLQSVNAWIFHWWMIADDS